MAVMSQTQGCVIQNQEIVQQWHVPGEGRENIEKFDFFFPLETIDSFVYEYIIHFTCLSNVPIGD